MNVMLIQRKMHRALQISPHTWTCVIDDPLQRSIIDPITDHAPQEAAPLNDAAPNIVTFHMLIGYGDAFRPDDNRHLVARPEAVVASMNAKYDRAAFYNQILALFGYDFTLYKISCSNKVGHKLTFRFKVNIPRCPHSLSSSLTSTRILASKLLSGSSISSTF